MARKTGTRSTCSQRKAPARGMKRSHRAANRTIACCLVRLVGSLVEGVLRSGLSTAGSVPLRAGLPSLIEIRLSVSASGPSSPEAGSGSVPPSVN